MAAQQLDTLQRTETSLKRLKKARAGEGEAGPGSQLSDMDKILAQLVLDVQVCLLSSRRRRPVHAEPLRLVLLLSFRSHRHLTK